MNATTETTAATPTAPQKLTVYAGPRGLQLATLSDMWRFSEAVSRSGLAPKGLQTQEAIFTALQMGAELGLPPMASLQNIAVINGRPALWGDAQLAVVRGTGQLEEFLETWEVAGRKVARPPTELPDTLTAVCRVKRKGYPATESSFSVADAKRANLWGKESPWKYYPARMLQMRARAFALRDQFGDALRGMMAAEELQGQAQPEAQEPEPIDDPITIQAEVVQAAPTEPAQEKSEVAPSPKPAAKANTAVQLGKFLQSRGVTLESFNAWAVDQGHYDVPASDWPDIQPDVADRLWASRTLIARLLEPKWVTP